MGRRAGRAIATGLVGGLLGVYACTDYDDAPTADPGLDAAPGAETGQATDTGSTADVAPTSDANEAAAVDAGDAGDAGNTPDDGVVSPDAATIDAAPYPACAVGSEFCWTFDGSESPPFYGATGKYEGDGATVAVVAEGAGKVLHLVIPASTGSSAALVWDSMTTDYAAGVLLRGRFKTVSVGGPAGILELDIAKLRFGLTTRTDGCPGAMPCLVAESDGVLLPGSAAWAVDTNWHVGELQVKRDGLGRWAGSVRIDGALIWSGAAGAFPDGTSTGSRGITAGAAHPGAISAATETFIDDLRLEKTP